MDFLPVYLRLQHKRVLLVGGGQVALRKARLLLRAQAEITVVAPDISAELLSLLKPPHSPQVRGFQESDLDHVVLAVAATDDMLLNRRVSSLANARKLPVNVVDQPALCSFIFPSIVDRSPLLVAVSSGGSAPVLSRLLRARLETLIPAAYGNLVQLMGRYRDAVKMRLPNPRTRMRFWEGIVNGPVAELVLSGQQDKGETLLQNTLTQRGGKVDQGEVYLVGAGPGDPDLLTFRALRLMQQADVVLFDRLVTPEILALVRQDAERIHVGKKRSDHTMPQEEISKLLVKLALQGKRVLRLKGGDPFIFGRGGEEIAELSAARIPFQIVPGITAASGCAAYAGIPLTHRDYAHSVRFVTGHLKDDSCELEWPQLVQPGQTVVFYMGLVSLPQICRELIAHGAAPATPVALVEQGTTAHQRVHTGTLQDLPALVAGRDVKPPTLIIVGEVVKLHDQLRWREEVAP
ncbi:MAG TPA: siroheme synthase CysG [Candidatus Acidoferrum sp.]|nr:siroheme synthase CysG [Candidatus Acidoferrum sp.]